MANGKRTLRKFSLYSEELLEYKGTRCFLILLHLIAFVLGISGCIIGVLSFTNDTDSPIPLTNCSLTTSIEQKAEFPLSLLLLVTGFVLIFIDIAITALLCIIKWKSCGILVVVWFMVIVLCSSVWTFLCVFYLSVVVPLWFEDRGSCGYLVLVCTLVGVAYCGVLTIAYLVAIVVVITYDCNRWCNLRGVS